MNSLDQRFCDASRPGSQFRADKERDAKGAYYEGDCVTALQVLIIEPIVVPRESCRLCCEHEIWWCLWMVRVPVVDCICSSAKKQAKYASKCPTTASFRYTKTLHLWSRSVIRTLVLCAAAWATFTLQTGTLLELSKRIRMHQTLNL